MNDLKYITYDNGISRVIVMFSPIIQHVNMAMDLRVDPTEVIGAGFINMRENETPYCYGKSVSLQKECHAEDNEILRNHFD